MKKYVQCRLLIFFNKDLNIYCNKYVKYDDNLLIFQQKY